MSAKNVSLFGRLPLDTTKKKILYLFNIIAGLSEKEVGSSAEADCSDEEDSSDEDSCCSTFRYSQFHKTLPNPV